MLLTAAGTLYPNAETWVYGEATGPRLLLSFVTPGSEPFSGLMLIGDMITGAMYGAGTLPAGDLLNFRQHLGE